MIVLEKKEETLKKKVIALMQNKPEQFLNSIFIIPNKSSEFNPVINLKNLNYVEYNRFKMERLFLLNELLETWDYLCKLNLKDTFFQCLFTKTLKKCRVSMETEVVPISLFLFRIDLSTQSVYKTHVSSNCYTNNIKYTVDSLLRRYSDNCEVSKGIDSGKGYILRSQYSSPARG